MKQVHLAHEAIHVKAVGKNVHVASAVLLTVIMLFTGFQYLGIYFCRCGFYSAVWVGVCDFIHVSLMP